MQHYYRNVHAVVFVYDVTKVRRRCTQSLGFAMKRRSRSQLSQCFFIHSSHLSIFLHPQVSSFNNLSHWVDECDSHNLSRSIPRIVVGNKCDQITDQPCVSANVAQKVIIRNDARNGIRNDIRNDNRILRYETWLNDITLEL